MRPARMQGSSQQTLGEQEDHMDDQRFSLAADTTRHVLVGHYLKPAIPKQMFWEQEMEER